MIATRTELERKMRMRKEINTRMRQRKEERKKSYHGDVGSFLDDEDKKTMR